jgi:ParB/RepB/Spo0J family partition protein
MTATITDLTTRPRKPKATVDPEGAKAIAAHPSGSADLIADGATYEPHLPLHLIDPDPQNRKWDPEAPEFKALLTSISAIGVDTPILVRPNPKGNGRYDLIAGERRYRASLVSRSTIPALIAVMTDEQAAIRQALENMRRHNLTPAEEIRAIVRCHTAGATVTTLANELGVSTKWVNNRLKLIELPAKFVAALDKGDLTWEAVEKASTLPAQVLAKIGTSTWEISQAVENLKAEKTVEKKVAEYSKKGIRVITDTKTKATDFYQLGLAHEDQKPHAKEPCHAIRITINYGNAREDIVCTDPARHKKGGASTLQARQSSSRSSTAAQDRAIIRNNALIAWATDYIPRHLVEPGDYTRICMLTINGCSWTQDQIITALQIHGLTKKEIRALKSVTDKKRRLHQYTAPGGIPGGAIITAIIMWITRASGQWDSDPLVWEWATTKGFTDPYPPTQQELEDQTIPCEICNKPLFDLDIEAGYDAHEECDTFDPNEAFPTRGEAADAVELPIVAWDPTGATQ